MIAFKKNEEIECLRGIAILFVLFHHVAQYLIIHPNETLNLIYSRFTFWGGVDLFFVISGFVIMNSLAKTIHKPGINFLAACKIFWTKRIFRILPVAWFWLAVYLLATIFVNYTGAFGDIYQNLKDSKAALFQYANIYGLGCWGKDSVMSCGPNGIYWSLSLEEQFYFLIPIFVFVFRQYLAWILLGLGFFQLFQYRPEWSIGWAFRTDALIWGVLIAIFYNSRFILKIRHLLFPKNTLFRWLIFIILFMSMAFISAKPNSISIGTGLLALICSYLVLVASFDQGYLFKEGIFKKLLLWLGMRSYSLYLTHIIVFRLSYEILYQITPVGFQFSSIDSYKLFLISLPILLILSELSFRFIEVPSKKLGHKLASKIMP